MADPRAALTSIAALHKRYNAWAPGSGGDPDRNPGWLCEVEDENWPCATHNLADDGLAAGDGLREALSGDRILGVAGQIRLFANECERQRPGQFYGWVSTWREWADAIDAALTREPTE